MTEEEKMKRIFESQRKAEKEDLQKQIDDLKNQNDVIINELKSNYKTQEDSVLDLINKYKDELENAKIDSDTLLKKAKENFENLKKTYEDKLELEEPAKYWEKRAKSLKRQGWIFFVAIFYLIIFICVFLGSTLINPSGFIEKVWSSENKIIVIKWIFIYITLISFIAFGFRLVSKAMLSSFHLARDSEERHTLTYFYLSLLKNSAVDNDVRPLIMQSLFSRADTGLLKKNSSPEMPSIILDMIKNKG